MHFIARALPREGDPKSLCQKQGLLPYFNHDNAFLSYNDINMSTIFTLCALVLSLISHNQAPLFADYYATADAQLSTMAIDQKIAQTLLVRYPDRKSVV